MATIYRLSSTFPVDEDAGPQYAASQAMPGDEHHDGVPDASAPARQPAYQPSSDSGVEYVLQLEDGTVVQAVPRAQNIAPRVSASYPPVQPPQVTRYRTEKRTAYEVRGSGGKIKVSAPVGSNEAELLDAVAAANSKPEKGRAVL
ncbi:hypothetical protein QBC46DRAFT_414507 [Diplogelasinospora grovesii]|uniref:Uncharacterized protein n=1 Tax=Diplogelasinospora grovesii TaxID=303347 RepID=A0AAN6MWW4_9PEZI|nr:hypothetical protein QBC46DRAFT_414507 [Diplogelasinospora grovesii]